MVTSTPLAMAANGNRRAKRAQEPPVTDWRPETHRAPVAQTGATGYHVSMPRPRTPPVTALGVALVRQRGARTLQAAAEDLGIRHQTLSLLERGVMHPSAWMCLDLARWLGWPVEDVIKASYAPAVPAAREDVP